MKILLKLFSFILVSVLIIFFAFYFIAIDQPCFEDTYGNVIQRKYETLKKIEGKKIVILGGSSAGFGIDTDLLKKKSGYEVANMGLHAGFGQLFNTEIALDNIKSGNIVLLAYEYNLNLETFSKLGDLNLIMSAIDGNLEMYSKIPYRNFAEILGNTFKFANLKFSNTSSKETSGTYSGKSFNSKGDMTLNRSTSFLDYNSRTDIYGSVSDINMKVTESNVKYLKKLKTRIENKGAYVYFVAPPILKEAVKIKNEDLQTYSRDLEKRTGIKFISKPEQYIFESEYMFDTIYHCNNEGEKLRTGLLIKDLQTILKGN